jgi:hypothetical protein
MAEFKSFMRFLHIVLRTTTTNITKKHVAHLSATKSTMPEPVQKDWNGSVCILLTRLPSRILGFTTSGRRTIRVPYLVARPRPLTFR